MFTGACKIMDLGEVLPTFGRSQGIRNSYWQEISFGDGFDVVPDKDDSQLWLCDEPARICFSLRLENWK